MAPAGWQVTLAGGGGASGHRGRWVQPLLKAHSAAGNLNASCIVLFPYYLAFFVAFPSTF